MLNDRLAAALLMTEKLTACEEAIDDALASAAELTFAVPKARRRANVSATVGQDAIALTGEAMAALHEARAKMVAAHHALAAVRDQMGLRTHAAGSMWKIARAPAPVVALVTDKAA
jgi:hypothetical protein